MSGSSVKEISLGDGFGDVAVKANGIRVELHADGSVVAYTQKDVDAYTNGAIHLHPAANDDSCEDVQRRGSAAPTASWTEPQIGDVMPTGHKQAGWIYMGPDDETGEVFYAAPKDESGTFTFNQAAWRAEKVGAKMPTPSQLSKMYRNRDRGALKDTFNLTGSLPAAWYWSSRDYNSNLAWAQRFIDGNQNSYFKTSDSSLRLVR